MAVSELHHLIEPFVTRPHLELITPCNRPFPRQWLWVALQLLAVAALQFGDDIVRGNLDPPNVQEVARLEQVHGFFIEPTLQLWAMTHLRRVGGSWRITAGESGVVTPCANYLTLQRSVSCPSIPVADGWRP